ncbi:Carboxypeptidase Q [Collichthys lucidus]|uniref:Carboxypeptidase Q n=1 Tax=Collichthys lucidus TaxID=240159 RepID=A0A4U5V291_COLLU|nr:Carboxypeptidase Q [Collichthys lucidus]
MAGEMQEDAECLVMALKAGVPFILSLFMFVSTLSSQCDCHPHPARAASNHTERKVSDMIAEVAGYADVAKKIIDLAVFGAAQNRSYRRLADFTDTIGNRVSGSHNLELAIKYMYNTITKDGLDVHLEPVKIPHWVRGKESAEMIMPRAKSLAILGLGSSVGTPPEGIEAVVLVVESFEELKRRANEAVGKIVVFNQPFVSYGETVAYRVMYIFVFVSPHTGWQDYQDGVNRIPTACITVEDAELMWRMAQRGQKIVVVLLSGHLDSWDVGQGAMDDGGGAMISWEALSLIRDLGLRPRRTLRTVLWTAEEQGGVGAQQYYNLHKINISNFDLVMESDLGTFTPLGLQFTGNDAARKVMEEVVKLLAPINTTKLEPHGEGTDISPWMQAGVPGASLHVADSRYFWFHHSEGDTMSVQDPREMNLCSALWAVVAYVVADLEDMLPR